MVYQCGVGLISEDDFDAVNSQEVSRSVKACSNEKSVHGSSCQIYR